MLNKRFGKSFNGSKVLVLGIAYKQDIDDYRESPAIKVLEHLRSEGAEVVFYDSYIPRFRHHGKVYVGEPALTAELLESCDMVVVTAAHSNVDYDFVQKHSKAIFDTKNVMKNVVDRSNIEVL